MLCLLLLIALGQPADPDPTLLAPGMPDYHARVERFDTAIQAADAIGDALGLVENALAAALRDGRTDCDTLGPLALRGERLGEAWRDAVQRARAAQRHVDHMEGAPTVVPLLSETDRSRSRDLREVLVKEAVRYAESSGWWARYAAGRGGRCPWTLSPVAGIAVDTPRAVAEQQGVPTAIFGVGGGLVCPGGLPADGRVIVVPQGRACIAEDACNCSPVPVAPAAVVAREPTGPSPTLP